MLSISAGDGSSSKRHRSRKCCWLPERSVSVEPDHLDINSCGVIILANDSQCYREAWNHCCDHACRCNSDSTLRRMLANAQGWLIAADPLSSLSASTSANCHRSSPRPLSAVAPYPPPTPLYDLLGCAKNSRYRRIQFPPSGATKKALVCFTLPVVLTSSMRRMHAQYGLST